VQVPLFGEPLAGYILPPGGRRKKRASVTEPVFTEDFAFSTREQPVTTREHAKCTIGTGQGFFSFFARDLGIENLGRENINNLEKA
jgi:hypothetical protein